MVEGGEGGPSFPVVFFDGEREMDIGSVQVNPSMEYKPFQLMLSQKIGISPNQISIYLVDRKKIPTLPFGEARRRIPITGKVNFGLICRQRDCSFLVVLKRSRKSRNRRERIVNGIDFSYFVSPPHPHLMSENLILLRRDQPTPFYDQITQSELTDLNSRLQSFRFQRENFQLAMGRGDVNSPDHLDLHQIQSPNSSNSSMDFGNRPFCKECTENESTSSFHPCVRDAIINGRFTSRHGPITRPNLPLSL